MLTTLSMCKTARASAIEPLRTSRVLRLGKKASFTLGPTKIFQPVILFLSIFRLALCRRPRSPAS